MYFIKTDFITACFKCYFLKSNKYKVTVEKFYKNVLF